MSEATVERITGFGFDDEGHCLVHLDCGHRLHARHQPPWQSRPWTRDAAQRRRLIGRDWPCPYCAGEASAPGAVPMALAAMPVEASWIDANGHVNVAFYVLAFDRAVDALLARIGMDAASIAARQMSVFSAEMHVCYLDELRAGDALRISGRVLGVDARRMHFFLEMHDAVDGRAAATLEQVALHVDLEQRRTAPFPEPVRARIEALRDEHAGLDRPPQAGRSVGLDNRRSGVRGS